MKTYIKIIGYLGMFIFIVLNIVNRLTAINDMIYGIVMILSLIMFIPLCVQEVLSLKNK
ncbi:hypothetical protein [Terrisporobacter mayombei]|uniref:Uncharacterized protein n=1 Tax=Terrisporobacter mayombei TaxID=1541 RepID=A0ABY9PYX8_9FIRM|nr:hypothetical protein [Terrisporobacter mayombei]MCC3866664.1 hypothetical protein [Terrisporobacter mayombei]WMT80901.1 hypothetical protein TEMA_12240 [Terrisporobacter mayombei]